MSQIQEHLPAGWFSEWEHLKFEFGDEIFVPTEGQVSVHWGPQQVLGTEKLSTMPVSEIAAFIKSFEPSARLIGPSDEDLSSELAAAVSTEPKRYASKLAVFYGLEPIYIEHLLGGFSRSVDAGTPFDWDPVIDLCKYVLNESENAPMGSWRSARREVVDLLRSGLLQRDTGIKLELRDEVWALLEELVEDPDPTPTDEAQQLASGPYQIAINSTRGRAMETAFYYGQWVYLRLKPADTDDFNFSLRSAPELKTALERHLKPTHDPSLAVRAVYGVFIPTLYTLDASWLKTALGRIFPADAQQDELRKAAWEAYLSWGQFDLSMLDLLRDEYMRAIEHIGAPTLEERGKPSVRLAEHLMAFYWHGKLGIDDPLLREFFDNASDDIRGEALGYLGRSLPEASEPVDPEVLVRLQALWASRLETATLNQDRACQSEMASFGWWFSSGKLDDQWAMEQLEASLRIAGKSEIDRNVVERLAALTPSYPVAAVRCFRLMVQGAQEDWRVPYWSEPAKSLLSTALRSGNEEATRDARVLINQLAARGYLDFKQLLDESFEGGED